MSPEPTTCILCGIPEKDLPDGTITIISPENQLVCENCIRIMWDILTDVTSSLDTTQHDKVH